MALPKPLKPFEILEFNALKERFFGGAPFVVLTKEEENTDEFKRYEELLNKNLTWLKWLNENLPPYERQ